MARFKVTRKVEPDLKAARLRAVPARRSIGRVVSGRLQPGDL